MSFKEKSKKLGHFLNHRKLDTFPLWEIAGNLEADPDVHVWERCETCSRRTHPNEIELHKGICADCALGDE